MSADRHEPFAGRLPTVFASPLDPGCPAGLAAYAPPFPADPALFLERASVRLGSGPTQGETGRWETAGAPRKRIVVVDPRAFVRGCLVCWLDGFGAEFQPIPAADVRLAIDAGQPPAAAILSAPALSGGGTAWLDTQTAWLQANAPDLPIVAVLDEGQEAGWRDLAIERGFRGTIPMSSSLEVAAAALRLVIAGGHYFPLAPGGTLPRADGARRTRRAGPGQPLRQAGKSHLTPREQAVLDLVVRGLPNKLIANQLNLALSTVKIHVHHIIEKLNVQNRTEAAIWGRDAQSRLPGQAMLDRDISAAG